jgi:hypothetical protein
MIFSFSYFESAKESRWQACSIFFKWNMFSFVKRQTFFSEIKRETCGGAWRVVSAGKAQCGGAWRRRRSASVSDDSGQLA